MTKKISVILLTMLLLCTLTMTLASCGTTTLSNITGITNFKDIDKIVIVNNIHIVDGKVEGKMMKEYTIDNEILEIFNVLSRAKYRSEEVDDLRVPEYMVRIYVAGHKGYIEYSWDMGFKKKDGYDGKLREGDFSMDEADKVLDKLEEIYYRG